MLVLSGGYRSENASVRTDSSVDKYFYHIFRAVDRCPEYEEQDTFVPVHDLCLHACQQYQLSDKSVLHY